MALAIAVLSEGKAEDWLRLGFRLYDHDGDALLSRQELRALLRGSSPGPSPDPKPNPKVQPQPHCAGLSLPPHDVHKLREVEAACLTHVGPAHAAGAGLAERRAYSRARHQRPRHADATPCIQLEELLRASQLEVVPPRSRGPLALP